MSNAASERTANTSAVRMKPKNTLRIPRELIAGLVTKYRTVAENEKKQRATVAASKGEKPSTKRKKAVKPAASMTRVNG